MIADGWLGAQLGGDAFRVEWPGAAASGACIDALREHAERHRRALYFAKVATTDVEAVRTLSAEGFYVVDVNVVMSRPLGIATVAGHESVIVRVQQPDDRDGVLEIAGSAFRYTRFHLDPLIPTAVAHALKRSWIESYVRGVRGDRLFVALDRDQRPAGFLAALVSSEDATATAVIDLIGIRADRQRSGVGTALVATFFEHYRDRVARYLVGTQAANVPSLAFYQRLGFVVTRTTFVLHKHTRP